MSIWSILSWVCVALLTGINIFIFIKLKSTIQSMMMNMFPGANSVEDATLKMTEMMKMFSGLSQGSFPGSATPNNKKLNDAINLLSRMHDKSKR